MGTDATLRLVYLALLGLMVAGWFFAQNRQNLSKTLQQAILWFFLFAGGVILYGLKDELRFQTMPKSAIEIDAGRIAIARSTDRHFYATLKVNDVAISFVIDTGATDMVLSAEDARRIGVDPDALAYIGQAQTANGTVRTARIKLKTVRFAGFQDQNVTAWVNDGEMPGSLLGMSYLSLFSRLEIVGDTLILTR